MKCTFGINSFSIFSIHPQRFVQPNVCPWDACDICYPSSYSTDNDRVPYRNSLAFFQPPTLGTIHICRSLNDVIFYLFYLVRYINQLIMFTLFAFFGSIALPMRTS